MAIFLAFYKLLLEKEQMHVFKRFYLLAAMTASLLIPNLVFVEYVEPAIAGLEPTEFANGIIDNENVQQPVDSDIINWNLITRNIYIIGLLCFGLRFLKNLFQIIKRVRTNPKLKQRFSIKVLLNETLPPHTFFRFVFLKKEKFESDDIPKEVILHEEVHARQLHSIDVVLIELVQVIFWFNPFVFWFKRSIKLNHEFLADSAVLKKDIPARSYQSVLLSYLDKESQSIYQSVNMANAINYSSIKKRFQVMKTQTSKQTMVLRSILVLPLFALLLYGFSDTEIIEKPLKSQAIVMEQPVAENIAVTDDAHIISLKVTNSGKVQLDNEQIQLSALPSELNKRYADMTFAERQSVLRAKIIAPSTVPLELIDKIDALLKNYGVQIIDVKGPTKSSIIKASNQELKSYNDLAKKFNRLPIAGRIIPLQELQVLEKLYRKMSPAQKQMAEPFPECLPEKIQEGASRRLMAEYNTLAKKYNEMPKDNMRISIKDVERLKYIYGLMSDKQKADAEPFPQFPEPPARPTPPLPPLEKDVKQLQKEAKKLQDQSKKLEKQRQKLSNVPVPPLPPTPMEPIDHVIEMAKKGASFYYEGKKISSDKAIELLKKNKGLNISTKNGSSKSPEVRISKGRIKVGKAQKKDIYDPQLGLTIKFRENLTTNQASNPSDSEKNISQGFESILKNAQKKNLTIYYKNEPVSFLKARDLLIKHKNSSAIISHLKHPKLKRLDIITDVDKSLKGLNSEQYRAISL